MSTQNNPTGLFQPAVNSYPPGATSPAQAAQKLNDMNSQKLQNINQMVAGKRRRRGGGGTDQINVPVIKPIYAQQNGNGTDTTSQQANISKYNTQGVSWAANDSQAAKMGGSKMGGSRRKHKKGGNPNWLWGCYSGGKRRTIRGRKNRNSKKNKNSKRRTIRRKH
jgi:stringent starvation protein B